MKEWHTTIGINGMFQSNTNKGLETLIPEYDLFDLGVFLFGQRLFKKTTVSGGLRFDTRSLDTDPFSENGNERFKAISRNFSNLSGSIGFSYEPSAIVTLKTNIARGFRAPTVAELSSNGTHEGTNRYEYGDEGLTSETSLQGDIGLELNYDHFNFGISGFYNQVSDFIFYRKLLSVTGQDSLVHVDGEDIPAFRFTQHDATLKGFELRMDIHPHPFDWLHFEQ
jgi:iron complex outermembrane receptor protein